VAVVLVVLLAVLFTGLGILGMAVVQNSDEPAFQISAPAPTVAYRSARRRPWRRRLMRRNRRSRSEVSGRLPVRLC